MRLHRRPARHVDQGSVSLACILEPANSNHRQTTVFRPSVINSRSITALHRRRDPGHAATEIPLILRQTYSNHQKTLMIPRDPTSKKPSTPYRKQRALYYSIHNIPRPSRDLSILTIALISQRLDVSSQESQNVPLE